MSCQENPFLKARSGLEDQRRSTCGFEGCQSTKVEDAGIIVEMGPGQPDVEFSLGGGGRWRKREGESEGQDAASLFFSDDVSANHLDPPSLGRRCSPGQVACRRNTPQPTMKPNTSPFSNYWSLRVTHHCRATSCSTIRYMYNTWDRVIGILMPPRF
jgi:hypothetical protein